VTRRSTIEDRALNSRSPLPAWNSLWSFVTSSSSLSTFKHFKSTCLRPRTDGALVSFSVYRICLFRVLRVLAVFGLNATLIFSLIITIIIAKYNRNVIAFTSNSDSSMERRPKYGHHQTRFEGHGHHLGRSR